MHTCPKCAIELISGARFCHRCGEKLIGRSKNCPACEGKNPFASVFCHHCGFHFEGGGVEESYEPRYPLPFEHGDVTEQVKALFFRSLRLRVKEEFDETRYSEFVERFYKSKFREVYNLRAGQIAEEATAHWKRLGKSGLPVIDRNIEASFDGLLDYFVIQFCPDLGGLAIPEAILKYERSTPEQTDLGQMLADYLAFGQERLAVYTDFISLPPVLLENACKSYLFAKKEEKLFFICDLSPKKQGKEGFAMSNRALYWRAPFHRARSVVFTELYDIKKRKDHLVINGHFFSVSPSMDLKLYKLLKKMKRWHQVPA